MASAPQRVVLLSVVAWVGVTSAGFNGGSFLNYRHNFSSFLMTVGWVLACACYALAWDRTRVNLPG